MNGAAPQLDARTRWLLLLLPFACLLLKLGGTPLFDVDEGAFSEATREMFSRHDFLSTFLNGAPRYDKPILIYWCQAIFVWLLGPNEWSFRLPSAIAAAFWCQAVGVFTFERAGRAAALFACAVAATSFGVQLIGRAAIADALLNMLLTLALFDAWRHLESGKRAPLLRSYLWIGLGVLTKGPIALLIPCATTLIFCASTRRMKDWLRASFDWRGWLILLAVAAPWYIAALVIHGREFIDGFILKHNVQRFSGPLEGHSGSALYYLYVIPLLLMPWLTWLLVSLGRLRADMAEPVRRFLWIWCLFVTAFFSLSGTKLPHYALYGCTPLFVLIALHRDAVRRVWLAALPLLVLLAVALALPYAIESVLAHGGIKDAYYAQLLGRIATLPLHAHYALTGGALATALALMFVLRGEAWQRVATAAPLFVVVFALAVMPLLGELLQGPIKRSGLVARNMGGEAVQWNINMPSFSVYRQHATPVRTPQAGELALTRADRLPADAKVDILRNEAGVMLVRMK